MSRLVASLSVLLALSLSVNVYLLWPVHHRQVFAPSPAIAHPLPAQLQGNPVPQTPEGLTEEPSTNTQIDISLLIDQGRLTEARDALHRALRAEPQNTSLLMLEAQVVIETENVGSALIYLYDLLDAALSDSQYNWVATQIDTLSVQTINTLIDVSAWDILSTFVEPLWQYAPDNRTYTLALAEAYAHQRLAAPMENVLASLLPENPEVSRIRALLGAAQQEVVSNTPSWSADAVQNNVNTHAIDLRRDGNHFVVSTLFDGTNMNLMIDTGASTTVLTERAFAQLSERSRRELVGEFRIDTAGGSFDAPLFRVNEIRLGPFALRELAVVVLPMENFRRADGLLGMNALKEFEFRIDQQNAQLYLSP